jgi:hypothetical protein
MLSTVRPGVVLLLLITTLYAQSQAPLGDFTGRYTFLRDGEEVQLTLDPAPTPETDWSKPMNLTGFVTRFGNGDADKDRLFDHFFKSGSLNGSRIKFVTRAVHGVAYEFEGKVERGDAASWAKDGYYVVRGKLTENVTDAKDKVKSRTREITMKSLANLDEEQK